jgi:shikimate dehydrogenase
VKRLGVLGWPVGHSRSPAMHNAALAEMGLADWHYQRLPVPPELFDDTVRGLPGAGFVGANVTVPHKHAALALADDATDRARAIGAANTLTFADGAIHADNTDAPGFIAALPRAPAGMRALVLGAGGSARAVVWALVQAGAADVAVYNRTPQRAVELAADLGARAVEAPVPADLLVNCTTAGLHPQTDQFKELPVLADDLDRYAFVVDLVYRPDTTPLLHAASERGAETVDGLEILVRQGALSLEAWTGHTAPLQAMRRGATQGQDDSTDERAESATPGGSPAGG